jgi:hypothetical protein
MGSARLGFDRTSRASPDQPLLHARDCPHLWQCGTANAGRAVPVDFAVPLGACEKKGPQTIFDHIHLLGRAGVPNASPPQLEGLPPPDPRFLLGVPAVRCTLLEASTLPPG